MNTSCLEQLFMKSQIAGMGRKPVYVLEWLNSNGFREHAGYSLHEKLEDCKPFIERYIDTLDQHPENYEVIRRSPYTLEVHNTLYDRVKESSYGIWISENKFRTIENDN